MAECGTSATDEIIEIKLQSNPYISNLLKFKNNDVYSA